jgi:hypothetical protein
VVGRGGESPGELAVVSLGTLDNAIGFHLRLAQDASFRAFARRAGTISNPGISLRLLVIVNNPGSAKARLTGPSPGTLRGDQR